MAVEQHQCRKSGVAANEAEFAGRILLKVVPKTKPKAYLKQT
jgi:hypothetical protein